MIKEQFKLSEINLTTVQLKCNLTPAGRKPAVYLPLTRVQRARYVRVKPVVPATGSSCHTGVPFTGTH